MDTKLKADVAESAVITALLRRGFAVLKPVGDRLPYDLALDVQGRLLRIQVKSAWYYNGNFTVDTRRTKTNRRRMVRARYDERDFDFAILYIDSLDTFYVMPVSAFSTFKSGISLVETKKRQRKPRSAVYRERWDLLSARAVQSETAERHLPNSVKPEMVIPSQAPSSSIGEGVETRRQTSSRVMAKMKV